MHSEEKAGKDVGEIVGSEPLGVTATNSIEEILALDADCVLYSPLMPNPEEVAAILRSGKNVVTPLGWFWPSAEERDRMAAPALEGGVTLHGTGIDPGGVTEQQPLFFAGAVVRDHLRARRGVLRHPHLQRTRRRPAHHGIRRHARRRRSPARCCAC